MTDTNKIKALVEMLNRHKGLNYRRMNDKISPLFQQKITLEPRLLKIALYSYLLICGVRNE